LPIPQHIDRQELATGVHGECVVAENLINAVLQKRNCAVWNLWAVEDSNRYIGIYERLETGSGEFFICQAGDRLQEQAVRFGGIDESSDLTEKREQGRTPFAMVS